MLARPVPNAIHCAIALWFIAVTGCGPHQQRHEKRTHRDDKSLEATGKYRLVVLVAIDQWPSWSFANDRKYVRAGFKRLLERGTVFDNSEIPYAATYTASGHAAMATGAPPKVTGIAANSWFDPTTGQPVYCNADATHPEYQSNGRLAKSGGISTRWLRSDGLAEQLRSATSGKGISIAMGYKTRATAFMLGKKPDYVVWYSADQAAFTTGGFFADKFPAWLAKHNASHPIASYFARTWQAHDPEMLAHATGRKDDEPGEATYFGLTRTFPHTMERQPARKFRASAFAPQALRKLAESAIDSLDLGGDDAVDLLGITFSSHDYVGHAWGQESWERLDVLLTIDRELARLLEKLDRKLGSENYAVVVTSDHGVTRLVETSRGAGIPATRIANSTVLKIAKVAARKILGDGDWIAGKAAESIYVTPATLKHPKRDDAIAEIANRLQAVPGIRYALPTAPLIGDCDYRRDIEKRICLTLDPDRAGHVYVVPEENSIITSYTLGTTHGTPNPDDSHIPIIVYAPGRRPVPAKTRASLLDVAPTISKLLGIPAPPAAAGRSLVD